MFVHPHNLIYFAFPKCASEFIREELKLDWDNVFDDYVWDKCSDKYCHIRPALFVEKNNVDLRKYTMFTLVRNPFDRLVSSWHFGLKKKSPFFLNYRSFKAFIQDIYDHRNELHTMPYSWMYMPADKYFDGVFDKVQFFKVENMEECLDWLRTKWGINIQNRVTNSTHHEHYSKYYDPEMRAMVARMFKYEIVKFGYTFRESR